ncbi:MAG: hypothetical protein K0S10_2353, partial [Rubrobacteraceae bacterium]|nr:hypothetical protein [Rubrobacteraceae bacterium]
CGKRREAREEAESVWATNVYGAYAPSTS